MRALRVRISGRPGFLLLEALIGFALFALFLGAVGLTLLVSQQGTASAGSRARGIALASQAMDGVRVLRDRGFSNLTDGTHGIAVTNGAWGFAGTHTQTSDGYVTTVSVSTPATNRKEVTVTTRWNRGKSGSGTVTLREELTNWRVAKAVGNWASPQLVGSSVLTGTPLLYRVTAADGYAYVSTEVSGGGPGLVVFDVTTPSAPVRVAAGFTLGGVRGYDLLVAHDKLYLLTSSASQELRIYDISSPSTLSSDALIGSYDLPGDGMARSLAMFGDSVVIGTALSTTEDEVFLLDISNPVDPLLQSSVSVDGDVLSISMNGAIAYLGSSENVAELRVVDFSDPSSPVSATGSGYNLADSVDAQAVAVTGTSAILGRAAGSFVEELVLFDLETGLVPAPPPGPWYREVGSAVSNIQVDLTQKYAFVAQGTSGHELSILNIAQWRNGGSSLAAQVALSTASGRGVFYDVAADRLYVVTTRGFYLYRPS